MPTWPIACSISCGVSLKFAGDHLSNCSDSSRTAASPRASIAPRICSTVSRTLASAALMALASIPRLRKRGMAILLCLVSRARRSGIASAKVVRRRPGTRLSCLAKKPGSRICDAALHAASRAGHAQLYLIACGLIGLPVPPVMISGGPLKKNS